MVNKKFQSEISCRIEKLLSTLPKERLKDVVERRFGLKNGKRETLDAIGQNYGITRERVRQIEFDALRILNERQNLVVLKPIFEYLDRFFEEQDHLVGEEKLLNSITGFSEPHPSRSAVIMVLTLGKPYCKHAECDKFYPHWTTKQEARKKVEKLVDYLIKHLNQQKQTIFYSDALNLLLSKHSGISKNIISNALDIAKNIDQNIFGEVGLSHWSDINPRGVRDRAYLVLKKRGEPKHFTAITDMINEANFSSRKAFPQTVHNELIKDERFVLIGRGIYALSEWGYEPGVVKEVIARILSRAKRPLTKHEIVSAVLKQRKIKPNTVIINLQNNSEFERLEDGSYRLKNA